MTGGDKICKEIMAATGCDYAAAMHERDRRWDNRELDSYLVALRKLPARSPGDEPLCVSCFARMPHRCRSGKAA